MRNYILSLFLLCYAFSYAQHHIYSKKDNTPVAFANISYGENKGLISNEDGYFELPEEVSDTQKIHVSHIAHLPQTILKSTLIETDTLFLEESLITLDEVVLKRFATKDTLLKAIRNINDNYITEPHNLDGFFRQSLSEDGSGIEMIEVEFSSYSESSQSNYTAKIEKARQTKNYSKLGLKTYGGVFPVIEGGDFVKNKSYFLDSLKIHNYDLELEGISEYNGDEVYNIKFKPKQGTPIEYMRHGSINIDAKTLAILEIDYVFDKEKLAIVAKQSEANLKTRKAIYRLIEVQNTIKYKKLDSGKWTLSFVEAKNVRKGILKKESFDYTLSAKMVINNVRTNNVKKIKTNYNIDKDFSKVVKRFDELSAWGNNYKFSLSEKDRKILSEIENKKNN